jgi:hypothetical protein
MTQGEIDRLVGVGWTPIVRQQKPLFKLGIVLCHFGAGAGNPAQPPPPTPAKRKG